MAQFVGMDPDLVRAIGKNLKARGSQIEQLVAATAALIQQIQSQWAGPDSQRFRQTWESEHHAALLRLAEAVDALGQTALSNADDQESASGAGQGLPGGAQTMPYLLTQKFGQHEGIGNLDPLDLRKIPLFSGVDTWDALGAGGKLAEIYGHNIPGLGTGMRLVDSVDFGYKVGTGQAGFFDFTEMAATGLKMSPNPVAKLGGLAINSWGYAAQEAMKIDYSPEATKATTDYAVQNPGIVVEEVGKATATVVTKFFSWL